MKVRFECLKRSRVAKHEVLRRVLRRKISDGAWLDSAGYCPVSRSEIGPALAKLNAMRQRLMDENVRRVEGQCAFLEHFPDVEIGYDELKQAHYLIV